LKALLDKLNPGTVGQITALRQKAKEIKLINFNNDVNNMITALTSIKSQIDDLGGTFDDYMMVCFSALLSGSNMAFNNLISSKQSEYYMGTLSDPAVLLSFAEANYNNFVISGTWNQVTVPDPSIIAAMRTELTVLKTALLNATTQKTNSEHNGKQTSEIAAWRYVKSQESVKRDGKIFHWCPKHKGKDGEMTGLYVTHKAEDHDDWLANKKKNNQRNKKKNADNQTQVSEFGKLQLDPALQAALVTGFCDQGADDEESQVN
jgi:hypothetical protein